MKNLMSCSNSKLLYQSYLGQRLVIKKLQLIITSQQIQLLFVLPERACKEFQMSARLQCV